MSGNESGAFVSQARRAVNKLFYRDAGFVLICELPTCGFFSPPSLSAHNAKLGVVTLAPANVSARWNERGGGRPDLRRRHVGIRSCGDIE